MLPAGRACLIAGASQRNPRVTGGVGRGGAGREGGAGLETEGRAGEEAGFCGGTGDGGRDRTGEGGTGRERVGRCSPWAPSCRGQQRTRPEVAGLTRREVVP